MIKPNDIIDGSIASNCSPARGDDVRDAYPLFQEGRGGSTPTSPLSFRIEQLPFAEAKRLNKQWHSRLPRMGTGFVESMPFLCFGAMFEMRWYAVAIWSNPVARNLPQDTWLELRRLAIAPDAPKNTASRMLGVMARLIRKAKPQVERLVSYHDTEVHSGGIYRAAGWTATTVNKDGNWTRTKRPRPRAQSEAAKQRWELPLV
jgi:hypothetical protein